MQIGPIALENRLPMISLVESGGADLPTQKEIFIPGGRMFRDLTRLSAAGMIERRRRAGSFVQGCVEAGSGLGDITAG